MRWGAKVLVGLLLTAGGGPVGAAELTLSLRTSTVEWGQPLRGHLSYSGHSDPGSIDITGLGEAFHVERGFVEVSKTAGGLTVRREAVSLYPRAVGRQLVPALAHGGARSLPVPIEVLPPRPEGAVVEATGRVPDQRVKAGQQLVIRLDVATTDSRVRVETEPLRLPSGDTFLLPPGKDAVGEQVRHSVGWAVFFRAPGEYRVELPPVRYQLFGRDLRKFYLPAVRIDVEPIPAYVPITVPVGQVAVASTLAGGRADRHWHLVVEAEGQLPAGVPELQAELATLAGIDASGITVAQRVEARPDGVRTVVELRAPLPALLSGVGANPPLTLRYFDPVSGRLQVLTHGLPRERRLPPWIGASLALVASGLAGFGAWWVRRAHRRWQARRAYLRCVAQAGDPRSLRRLLLAEGSHRTLGEWAAARPRQESARVLAADLDAACFARNPLHDASALQQVALRLVRRRPTRRRQAPPATSRRS